MHELSICRDLLELISEAISGEMVTEVKTVTLEIGQFSHLEESSLGFCFEAVAQGSPACRARLEIIRCKGEGECSKCGNSQALIERFEPCNICGEFPIELIGGEQMKLKSLEVF